MKIPDELSNYLKAVHEANERIVARKKRELDPKLQDDDLPWLVAENEQVRLQVLGFEDALGEEKMNALVGRLVIHEAKWETWHDVINAAEKMNAEIEKVLG